MGGELDALRWRDWKVSFANVEGGVASGSRKVSNMPIITNLKADCCLSRGTENNHDSQSFDACNR